MKPINAYLTEKQCWEMVNRIQNGRTPDEIRERCRIADAWLTANKVISMDAYDSMMMTVALLHRESYHI